MNPYCREKSGRNCVVRASSRKSPERRDFWLSKPYFFIDIKLTPTTDFSSNLYAFLLFTCLLSFSKKKLLTHFRAAFCRNLKLKGIIFHVKIILTARYIDSTAGVINHK